MPRATAHTPENLTERALRQFWLGGYHATSMDDLVTSTGVSRHGIYAAFGGKRALYLACFDRYAELVVSPAFAVVEKPQAGSREIRVYFEHQIAAAEAAGLPGPGCFVANAATEVAPHDAGVAAAVTRHNRRLALGFRAAMQHQAGRPVPQDLALALVIFATGLWSMSRVEPDAQVLRQAVAAFLDTVERSLR
jgi:TetR/AcrR family transcriptional regulator, transcriptional repressor for nem operon